jgi:hypothetical protein
VGGGSNAIGMFHPFIGDASVEIIGIEAGGTGKALGPERGDAGHRAGPAFCMAPIRLLLQIRMARSRKPIRYPRGSIIRAWGPSTRCCCGQAECVTRTPPTTNRWMRSPSAAAARASCLPSRSAHALAGARRWARLQKEKGAAGKHILIGLSAAATRTCPRCSGRCWPQDKNQARNHDSQGKNQRRHPKGARRQPRVVAFVTAGFPSREHFREHLTQVGNAADVVEIGVPFTDPMAGWQ